VCFLTLDVFASSDRRHTGDVPTISLTDAVSLLHRCLLFPTNEPRRPIGVSVILYQLLGSPMIVPDVSLIGLCYPRLIIDRICQVSLFTSYGIGQVFWYLQCCGVSLALAIPQWYWLCWNMLQVIIITRLHAMYQGSRKILISLIVTFLSINIFDVVVVVMATLYASGGTLNCGWQKSTWGSLMNIRGTHSLRYLSVLDWLVRRSPTSGFHYLDTWHCMGGPRTMSRSLDCGKTLPWTATTFDRRDYGGLFHGIDQNSHALLCEVSSYCDCCSIFSTDRSDAVALLLFLASTWLLISLQHSQGYVNLLLTSACDHSSSFL
jgi:hypothetical protein